MENGTIIDMGDGIKVRVIEIEKDSDGKIISYTTINV